MGRAREFKAVRQVARAIDAKLDEIGMDVRIRAVHEQLQSPLFAMILRHELVKSELRLDEIAHVPAVQTLILRILAMDFDAELEGVVIAVQFDVPNARCRWRAAVDPEAVELAKVLVAQDVEDARRKGVRDAKR